MAFLVCHGHRLDYYYSLSETEKIFLQAVMSYEEEKRIDELKMIAGRWKP